MSISSPSFEQLRRHSLRQATDLTPIARDRIVADLRLQYDHPGEYVAYLDRRKIVDRVQRLCRDVLAHSPSIEDVQNAVEDSSDRDRPNVVVTYVEAFPEQTPQLLYELPGR